MSRSSFFESLEKRQMMSATLRSGVLTIEGTDLADVIAVSQDAKHVRVNENGKVTAFKVGSVKSVVINAKGGNDQLLGRTNLTKPMTLRGGAGNDTLVGGARGDVFEGGPGQDRADYSHRNQNMNISLDDVANDGATNEAGAVVEKDNVKSDVEVIRTGNGNDLIRGSNADNIIDAGFGLDTVYGMGGHDLIAVASRNHYDPDTVYGGEGNDWIETTGAARLTAYGEGGNDKIVGGSANDTLDGGVGTDSIYGNAGNDDIAGGTWRDHLFGGPGNDTIRGGRGDDIIDAGDGDDTVWGDAPPITRFILGGTTTGGGILGGGILDSIKITPTSDSDVINGGAGNDLLHGGDDADTLSGGAGDDKLWGDAGNDVLRGNAGHDTCYGGDGNDNLSGDEGNDLIVSVGGGAFDTLFGGAGSDNFWADAEDSEQIRDADLGEGLFGGVKRVAGFMNNVSRNLNGQNLPDPDGRYRGRGFSLISPSWNNFKDTPFVGAAGISEADVQQGQTGDCWMLAAVAAAAKFSKIRLTTSMVDLGDGTYAFKFIDGAGNHQFVRVDADLPVWSAGSTLPRNAGFGTSNVSWVAMLEKAFAVFGGGNSYRGLNGQNVRVAFAALGMRDAGNLFVAGDGSQTLQNIQDAMKQGKVVTLSTPDKAPPAGANVIKDHAYVVESINTMRVHLGGTKAGGILGGLGKGVELIYSVTLRNPWGTDGAGSDAANDGLVTVRLQDVARYFNYAQAAWA